MDEMGGIYYLYNYSCLVKDYFIIKTKIRGFVQLLPENKFANIDSMQLLLQSNSICKDNILFPQVQQDT